MAAVHQTATVTTSVPQGVCRPESRGGPTAQEPQKAHEFEGFPHDRPASVKMNNVRFVRDVAKKQRTGGVPERDVSRIAMSAGARPSRRVVRRQDRTRGWVLISRCQSGIALRTSCLLAVAIGLIAAATRLGDSLILGEVKMNAFSGLRGEDCGGFVKSGKGPDSEVRFTPPPSPLPARRVWPGSHARTDNRPAWRCSWRRSSTGVRSRACGGHP